MRGLVGQPGRPGHVADGVKPGHAGGAVLVDDHMRAIDFHAQPFQAQVLDIADDAHRDDGHVRRERFGLPARLELHRDAGA